LEKGSQRKSDKKNPTDKEMAGQRPPETTKAGKPALGVNISQILIVPQGTKFWFNAPKF
jgi:hypothetical protein